MKLHAAHKYFKHLPPALLAVALLASLPAARANDAALDLSGSPRLMKGHPGVAMQSEVIRLSVGRKSVTADCRFTFVNYGSACTVRMGFPDDSYERQSSTPDDPQFGSTFTRFQSYVDGRAVATRTETGPQAQGRNTIWRVKSVSFGARSQKNSVRRVREKYTVGIGSETTFLSEMAGYTLHTGSSWNGPIGRSEITVRFDRPLGRRRLRALAMSDLNPGNRGLGEGDTIERIADPLKSPGTVVYEGPGRAQVLGPRTLRWVRTKWRPTVKDDILVHFKMP